MNRPFNPKEHVMYYATLDDATVAYHFETFKYRRAGLVFCVIPMEDGLYAVTEKDKAEELGWKNVLHPDSELNFESLNFDRLDEIYDNNRRPHFWDQLERTLSMVDRDLLIFIIQTQFPIEQFIRHYLMRQSVNTDNRIISKVQARILWDWEETE